jgi:hypothetical protein
MTRCAKAEASHISGTPSHWRRLLMSPFATIIDPKYVRLSGEIADRALLDALRVAYPKAVVSHACLCLHRGGRRFRGQRRARGISGDIARRQ